MNNEAELPARLLYAALQSLRQNQLNRPKKTGQRFWLRSAGRPKV